MDNETTTTTKIEGKFNDCSQVDTEDKFDPDSKERFVTSKGLNFWTCFCCKKRRANIAGLCGRPACSFGKEGGRIGEMREFERERGRDERRKGRKL